MKSKILSLIAALALLLFTFASCAKDAKNENGAAEREEDTYEYNTFAGVVVSAGERKVNKSDNFEVSEIKVSVGDKVEEGDVLFTYNTEKAALDLERSELELEQLEINLNNLRENKDQLERGKNAAPADQQLRYDLEIQQAETDILEAEYNIKIKTKEIETMREDLVKTEELSPAAGTVTAINNTSSEYYDPSKGFIVITESGSKRIRGAVNEGNLGDVNIGASVTIRSRVDDREWRGTVSDVDLEGPIQEQNGEYAYYNYTYAGGDPSGTSSKYPFYVELTDPADDLILGQHVYIVMDPSDGEVSGENDYDQDTFEYGEEYETAPEQVEEFASDESAQ